MQSLKTMKTNELTVNKSMQMMKSMQTSATTVSNSKQILKPSKLIAMALVVSIKSMKIL